MALARKGAEYFLLDDGFQHLALARDVDMVLLDASDPFGGNSTLPAGRLREPKSALRRAGIVVITRTDHAPALEAMVRRYTSAPVFYARTKSLGVFALEQPGQPSALAPVDRTRLEIPVFAFCGIANPRAFFDDLARWGFQVAGRAEFADHHRYSLADAQHLESVSRATGSEALLCTEKDVFNLRGIRFGLPIFFLRIALEPVDREGLWRAISSALRRGRGAKAA